MNKFDSALGDKIRVLIVDDHAMVRQGLRTFLELQDTSALPIEVAREAANGIEAVKLVRQTRPDIVMLDLVMPEMDGFQATLEIRLRDTFDLFDSVVCVVCSSGSFYQMPTFVKNLLYDVLSLTKQPTENFSSTN